MAARREVAAAVAERYRAAGRGQKGRILDELCATTGWHRKHALRVLRAKAEPVSGKRCADPTLRDRQRVGDGRAWRAIDTTIMTTIVTSLRLCGPRAGSRF